MKNTLLSIILVITSYTCCFAQGNVYLCNVEAVNSVKAKAPFLSKEDRIYSLSKIWKEMEYNFAYPYKLKAANLDSLYYSYLPLVENVRDEYEYYRVLSSFFAHFNEAHTRLIPPVDKPYDMPAITLSSIGKNIFVRNIARSLSKQIPLNSEVSAVDGIPVITYLQDSIYQYISAATTHWKFDKSVTEMLYGRPGTTVALTIKTPKGKIQKVSLKRDFYLNGSKEVLADTIKLLPLEVQYLKGGIGYLHLNTCTDVEIVQKIFYKNMSKLLKCKGLIVDVRGNRGGSDLAWSLIAYCSMPGTDFGYSGDWVSRKHIATYKFYGDTDKSLKEYYEGTKMMNLDYPKYKNGMPDSLKFKQPMVILSGQYVGSATEDFVEVMKENKRAVVIGTPTVGCIGEPSLISLPGGYYAMICTKAYITEDGKQLNDTGILPDIEVQNDFSSYLKGRDLQLERAIRELKNS